MPTTLIVDAYNLLKYITMGSSERESAMADLVTRGILNRLSRIGSTLAVGPHLLLLMNISKLQKQSPLLFVQRFDYKYGGIC